MADYIHVQSGARVSVADDKVLGAGFKLVGESVRSDAPDKSWKVAELKEYAAGRLIDLGEATKKDEILAAIDAHYESDEESDEDESDDSDESDEE